MYVPILSAAALGVAILSVTGVDLESRQSGSAASVATGPSALVGRTLWASEDPIDRWGAPPRAEDLALEDLGTVTQVVTAPLGFPDCSRSIAANVSSCIGVAPCP